MLPDSLQVTVAAAPLSEEWGGTYLQVIVTLIIFALGIPALLIQSVAPEVHRIAASRKHDGSRLLRTAMLMYLAVAFVFVGVYHFGPVPWLSLDDGWLGLLSIGMVAVTMVIWLRQLGLPVRDRLARRLAKDARRSFRKKGAIPEHLVTDLLDLGTAVPRQRDRLQVLKEIQTLVVYVRASARYRGDGLEQLLMAASRIAADPALPVDADNVEMGAKILLAASRPHPYTPPSPHVAIATQEFFSLLAPALPIEIRHASLGLRLYALVSLRASSDVEPSADMVGAIRAFVRMLQAVTLKAPETTVNKLLQDFSAVEQFPPSLAAKGLFAIGRMALSGGRNQLAVMCLNHLEDVLDRSHVGELVEVENNLLGLAAHLWQRCRAGRKRLLGRPLIAAFIHSLTRERRERYVEYYLDKSDFETAEFIFSFCRELRGIRRGRISRKASANGNGLGGSASEGMIQTFVKAWATRLLS
jgi:hypothetical protein